MYSYGAVVCIHVWILFRITTLGGDAGSNSTNQTENYTGLQESFSGIPLREMFKEEHVNEFMIATTLFDYKQNNNVTVTVSIRDAECFAASTASSFTVYLAAIDYDDKFVSWEAIESEKFTYHKETGIRTFTGEFDGKLHGTNNLDECFDMLHHDCAPRADAVFIRFDNRPEDAWAIDQIFVDTSYRMGPTEQHEQKWHFEHPILLPCVSWLDDSLTYQIGPRNGLFISRSYRYTAKKGEWIRSWV